MIIRILVFYVLTFFFTVLLAVMQQQTVLLPWLILPQWGPGIAGLLMLLIFRKDKHRLTLAFKREQLGDYALAILLPLVISAAAIAFFVWGLRDLPANELTLLPGWLPAAGMLIGAVGEEIGWRAYLQKRLNTKMKLLWSTLLVAALWVPWHVNNFSYGITFAIGFILAILGYAFFIAYLSRNNYFNLLTAVLFHWSINLVNSAVPTNALLSGRFMLTLGIVWALAAGLLYLTQRETFAKTAAAA